MFSFLKITLISEINSQFGSFIDMDGILQTAEHLIIQN